MGAGDYCTWSLDLTWLRFVLDRLTGGTVSAIELHFRGMIVVMRGDLAMASVFFGFDDRNVADLETREQFNVTEMTFSNGGMWNVDVIE